MYNAFSLQFLQKKYKPIIQFVEKVGEIFSSQRGTEGEVLRSIIQYVYHIGDI